MKFHTISGMLTLATLALIAHPAAQAQDPGWYLGANIGKSKAKVDDPRITSSLLGEGFTTTAIDDRNRSTGGKLFGGYQFNRYFAMEGGYFNLGHFGYTASTVPPGTLDGTIKVQGVNLDAVGILPLGAKFSLVGRVGLTYAQAKDTFTGTGFVNVLDPTQSKSAANYKFGGGLQYDITQHVGLRAEVERYRINDAIGNRGDIDMASLGVLVRFGHAAPAPVPAEAAPAPVPPPAPVPVVTPALVVVPAPQGTEVYCSILDLQFDIDKDEIQREDKEKLKVVGTFMNKYPNTTAVIEGHSDNVGSVEHNATLSKHRAESVVNYLMDDFHIASSRLSAVGYGDERPIADNATEEGKRQNRRIDAVIACATDVEGLQVLPARITMAMAIDFDQNQAEIKPEYDGELTKLAHFMKANPTVTATVEGHTGNVQLTPEKAMAISQLRAQNVVEYLVTKLGVDRARLTATGFGKGRRFAYNTSAEGRQENRRVNIIFNYPK